MRRTDWPLTNIALCSEGVLPLGRVRDARGDVRMVVRISGLLCGAGAKVLHLRGRAGPRPSLT